MIRNPGLPFRREPRSEKSYDIINPAIIAWRERKQKEREAA